MALADWTVIGPAWRARHADWRVEKQLVLAQAPTLTSVSRQALIGGVRPADLVDTWGDNRAEARRWAAFWAGERLLPEACPCAHLALDRAGLPAEVDSARTRALCLIDHKVDELAHDATLGSADFYASLNLWLEGYGRQVEALIAALLGQGTVVYLASDHGHVEARGYGRPREGVTVDTRGQRARPPDDRLWLHYGLTLLYYGVFREVAATMGQLGRLEERIQPATVKQRLTSARGQLGSLEKAVERIMFSLHDWGILAGSDERSAVVPRRRALAASNADLEAWLLACALHAYPAQELPFADLLRLPELFAFRFTLGVDCLRQHPWYAVQRQGSGWDMVRLRER